MNEDISERINKYVLGVNERFEEFSRFLNKYRDYMIPQMVDMVWFPLFMAFFKKKIKNKDIELLVIANEKDGEKIKQTSLEKIPKEHGPLAVIYHKKSGGYLAFPLIIIAYFNKQLALEIFEKLPKMTPKEFINRLPKP